MASSGSNTGLIRYRSGSHPPREDHARTTRGARVTDHASPITRHRSRFPRHGITPRCEEYSGDDPLGFVVSHNLHRRHMNESQRGMVGAKLANLPRGNPSGTNESIDSLPSRKEAGEMLNVGITSTGRRAGHRPGARGARGARAGPPRALKSTINPMKTFALTSAAYAQN